MELRAQTWIESVLNEKFTKPFEDALKDGIILCNLMNTLKPGNKAEIAKYIFNALSKQLSVIIFTNNTQQL
jgi:hypothetical protein